MHPDIQLQRDLFDELQYEPTVDSCDIGITVKDGIVTLSGKVKSLAEKWSAVRAAERVAGVKAIVDEIEVELLPSYERTDEDLARTIVNVLKWNVLVPDDRIKVHVENGWVILKGTVDYWHEQIAVESAVRNLSGVRRITNHIKVKPVITHADVKAKIESAMRRAAELDAQQPNWMLKRSRSKYWAAK